MKNNLPFGCRFFLSITCLLVGLWAGGVHPLAHAAKAPALKHPDRITYKPLAFTPPRAERATLANGIILYLLANHELPLVKITAVIRTGSMYDPPGKEGLAELTGQVMRTGGIEGMAGDALDEALESMAAVLTMSVQRDSTTLSLSVLRKDRDKGLALFSRILQTPRFETEKLALARDLKIEELRRIADDPQKLAFREFGRLMHEGSPRGRLATPESVGRIQREDLIGFHGRFMHPRNVMISVSGDILRQEAETLVKKHFGDWRPSGEKPEPLPFPRPLPGKMYFLSKDLPQSIVIYGWPAPAKNDPQSFPFTIIDFIVGSGGFRSRIFQEIRTNQGLAYSAGSFYSARSGYGFFGAYTLTKSESTVKVLSLLREIVEAVGKTPVPAEELDLTKNALLNSFIFSFTSADQIAKQQLLIEYEGLPDDYLITYRNNISNVSVKDIERIAGERLHPDRAILLIVGNEQVYKEVSSLFPQINRIAGP